MVYRVNYVMKGESHAGNIQSTGILKLGRNSLTNKPWKMKKGI